MTNKLYVGNLPYTVDEQALRHNFSGYGEVQSARLMMDRETGRSKGFAFVEMGSAAEAQAAIEALNGMSVQGRSITVNLSRPKEDNGPRGGRPDTARRSY
jgi:RNA recognition motif-containing protein